MSSGWSDEAVVALRELISNPDLSYEQIGQDPRINKPRGAVCGKVDRLGLGRKSYASVVRNKARIKALASVTPKVPTMPQTGDFQRIMASHRAIAEIRTLKSLADLGDAECRMVYGDPMESRNVYCGQPAVVGLAYCPACVRRVYDVVEVQHVAHGPQRQKAREWVDA